MSNRPWFVYMLACRSGRIYTGVTPDLASRMSKHRNGTGAMFTRLNTPEKLLAARPFPSKVEAMRVEYQIKRLKAQYKHIIASRWCQEYPLHQLAQQFPALVEYII